MYFFAELEESNHEPTALVFSRRIIILIERIAAVSNNNNCVPSSLQQIILIPLIRASILRATKRIFKVFFFSGGFDGNVQLHLYLSTHQKNVLSCILYNITYLSYIIICFSVTIIHQN